MPPGSVSPAVRRAPPVEDIDRIAAIADPCIRNLEITNAYHELALAVAALCGTAANWCTFATWASRQAGDSIRGEDLFIGFRERLNVPPSWTQPLRSLWRAILRAGIYTPTSPLGRLARAIDGPLDPFERASDAIARGNAKVFAEIGREFARFLAAPPRTETELSTFLAGLADGDPPAGQSYLQRAFTRYWLARSASGRERAELLFLANLEIGFHEQVRLQGEIAEAMNAPVEEAREFGLRLLAVLVPASAAWSLGVRSALAGLTGALAAPLARFRQRVARRVITEHLMTLRLPGRRVLRLGRRLEAECPADLREPQHADLKKMLELLAECHTGTDDCGAEDWSELRDRMHYITRYFRCFHADRTLDAPPYTPEQLAEIRAGRLPSGVL